MAKPGIYARPRHVYHRVYSRLRHGVNSLLKVFVDGEAERLEATPASHTFTVDISTDIFTAADHGFHTGKGPIFVSTDGELPAPLQPDTPYWPIRVNANEFRLAATREHAARHVHINITTEGTGTHSVANAVTGEALLERLRQGVKPDQLRATDDIDSL